eukprot:3693037-Pyramimonas_sp.AAC.1
MRPGPRYVLRLADPRGGEARARGQGEEQQGALQKRLAARNEAPRARPVGAYPRCAPPPHPSTPIHT